MSSGRRMAIIERDAQRRLKSQGYATAVLNSGYRQRHHGPTALFARRARVDGGDDSLFVLIRISLHRLDSRQAEVFCGTEIRMIKQKFSGGVSEADHIRFEVWVSIPKDQFQVFEIDARGIREIGPVPADGTMAGGRK